MVKILTWAMRIIALCGAIRLYQIDAKFASLIVSTYAIFAIWRLIVAYQKYKERKNNDA